jgi:type IV pilus assembly protein PilV
MVIMLVGLLGLLQSINLAMEHNSRNHLREEATRVGEREMNVFRATTATSTLFKRFSSATLPGKVFTVTRTSTPVGTSNSRELEIIVGWNYKNKPTEHRVKSIRTQ